MGQLDARPPACLRGIRFEPILIDLCPEQYMTSTERLHELADHLMARLCAYMQQDKDVSKTDLDWLQLITNAVRQPKKKPVSHE